MAEKDKGFRFKSLFFRDVENNVEESNNQENNTSNHSNNPETVSHNPISHAPTVRVQDQSLVDDFVQRLQHLINQNNQPGFDFLEFTESLFEEKQNPDPEVYKTVFRIAQKIDKSLTSNRLIDSAITYKDLVQRTAEAEIDKGESKKQRLLSEKDTERNTLDTSIKDIRAKIQQLTQQIQELQNQDIDYSNQLLAIDQKYGSQLIDIDRKITAIRSAKEQVLVSIVEVEAGIKMNLS
jgi:uncharacterized protein YaaR (DUF327 family)